MSEMREVEVNFEVVPTIKEAWREKMFGKANWWEIVIWFPALWTAGRYAHVYFAVNGIPYHVSNLHTSELRHQYNTEKRYTHTFKIWVDKTNLLKAMVCVDKANAMGVGHLWCNCVSTISVLLYGHDRRYGLFGTRFGWFTRRCLRDIEHISVCQG